jgi:predicted Zn-dependent protease
MTLSDYLGYEGLRGDIVHQGPWKKLISVLLAASCLSAAWGFPARADSLNEAEKEARLGNLLDLYAAQEFVLLEDEGLYKKISLIVQRLHGSSRAAPLNCRVRIINDSMPTAISFPGHIYVSTGLLDVLGSEEELAAVLATALARMDDRRQYNTFISDWGDRKAIRLLTDITVLGGGMLLGAMVAASTNAYQDAASFNKEASNPTGAAIAAVSGAVYAAAQGVREKKVVLSRIGHILNLGGSLPHLSCASVFFRELYEGYEAEAELDTVRTAAGYLKNSGYGSKALLSAYGKLLSVRDVYLSKGYVSGLLTAKPGLEGKMKHLEKNIRTQ